jgi:hypothetical protein
MHTYIVLFTLLTFSSVAVSAGLQEVLNAAKCIADIHQELPNSCVFIMKSEGEEQVESKFDFFPARIMTLFGKTCAQILSHQRLQAYLEVHFWKGKDLDKSWECNCCITGSWM